MLYKETCKHINTSRANVSIILIIKIYKTIFKKSNTEAYSMLLLPLWHFFFNVTGIFCKSIDKDQIKWSHLGPKLVFWIPLAATTVYVLFSSLCHNRNWTSDTLWHFHTCLIFIIFNSCFHIGDMSYTLGEGVCISPMGLWSCSDFVWRVLVVLVL